MYPNARQDVYAHRTLTVLGKSIALEKTMDYIPCLARLGGLLQDTRGWVQGVCPIPFQRHKNDLAYLSLEHLHTDSADSVHVDSGKSRDGEAKRNENGGMDNQFQDGGLCAQVQHQLFSYR